MKLALHIHSYPVVSKVDHIVAVNQARRRAYNQEQSGRAGRGWVTTRNRAAELGGGWVTTRNRAAELGGAGLQLGTERQSWEGLGYN